MKLMMCVALGGALGGAVYADTVAPRPLPKVNKQVVVQQNLAAQAGELNKVQAYQLTANTTNSTGTILRTPHTWNDQVRDPFFVATRVFGKSWAPFKIRWDIATEKRFLFENTAPSGSTAAPMAPGDTFNVIGNVGNKMGHYIQGSYNGGPPNISAGTPHVSTFDNPLTNAKPDALVFATPRNADARSSRTAFTRPFGVTFDTHMKRWALITEDKQRWGAEQDVFFNLVIFEKPVTTGDVRAFRFVVDSKNPDGPTRLPKALAGRDDIVVITHVVGTKGVFLDEPLAVGLEPDTGLWTIVTPSKKIPDGAEFNVLVAKRTK